MICNSIKRLFRLTITAASFTLCSGIVLGQPAKTLAALQQKYPRRTVVVSQRKLDVAIDIVNNAPQISLTEEKELVVLADNSTFLADTREYFNNHYEVSRLEAYSLVPDQHQYKKLPVTRFTRTVEIDNSVFFDDQYAIGFTFPSVGKGTRLVTKSTATTGYAYLPVIFDFGSPLPAENMVLTVSCPKNIRINYHLFGMDTSVIHFNVSEKGERMVYQWKADNPKSYERDSEAPALRYFIPHIIIQVAGYSLNGSYTGVMGTLRDLYAFNYSNIHALPQSAGADITELTDSIVSGCIDGRDKVRHIFRWVQRNIKYVAIEDGENGVVPREASLVLKRRYGDCKDKTSILVSMIRSQHMKASYAWIGSRSLPYKYSVFPSVINDDHMIAVWWDKDIPVILDGTTYSHKMEDVPAFIQGKECMIEKGKDDFLLYTVPVALPAANSVYDSLAIRLQGDTLIGTGFAVFQGEQKASMIAEFDGKDAADWADIVQRKLPKASNKFTVTKVEISDIHNPDQPFTIQYEFLLPDYLVRTSKFTYVNLYLNRFLQQTAILADRWIPVEAEMTMDHFFVCSLQIPDGCGVGKLPDDAAYRNSWFGFTEQYRQMQNLIMLTSHITINFQVIEGDEMIRFREMLARLNKNYLNSLPLEKTTAL